MMDTNISLASVEYSSISWPHLGLCDTIYVPWSGFVSHPFWSEYNIFDREESFNSIYIPSLSAPDQFRLITGGEPLVQDIESFISLLKHTISCPISLCTDGSDIQKMTRLVVNNLVDHMILRIWQPPSTYKGNLFEDDRIYEAAYVTCGCTSHEILIPYDPNFVNIVGILDEFHEYPFSDMEHITIKILNSMRRYKWDYLEHDDMTYNMKKTREYLEKICSNYGSIVEII
jgi:hypothetical protein